ncbi:MAG TPA: AAA family ATPase [Ktedonobacterales bacterium]|nr:AAA family ATPase [Ktedonobacterales bacterium]
METPATSRSFATLLKRYRRAAGLTQAALAERAGYSTDYVSKLERGVRVPLALTLEALAEALQLAPAERASLERAARRVPLPSTRARLPRWGGLQLDPERLAPLVGRLEEQRRLERSLAGEGSPFLLLEGEPGIGKTRLLQDTARQGNLHGLQVLAGGCHRQSGHEPYAPFEETLLQALAQQSPGEQQQALAGCEWLVRLLPELAEATLLAAPTRTLPPAQERRLLFAAVGRFLANVAGSAGTLLVLDDLQWAGADALDLLGSLVRAAPGSLRVVGAYRQTEVRPEDPLSLMVTDLAREGLARRLVLGPLTTEEATTLLEGELAELEAGQRAAAVQRILARAGGVPFFLVSCAQGLQASALGEQAPPPAEAALPQHVTDSIRQRLALLPETAQYLLGAAAVAGREIPRTLLSALAAPLERSQRDVLEALEATGRARLLVEQDEEQYAFAHDLIREVLLADLSAARQAMLHQQIAEALERGPGEPPIERLADHYRRAGLLERAVVYLERAGDRAAAMYAYAEAERAYQDVVVSRKRLGQVAEAARASEKLGKVLAAMARYDQAIPALEEAMALAASQGDRERWGSAMAETVRILALGGTPEQTGVRLPSVLAYLETHAPSPSLLKVCIALGYHYFVTGRYAELLALAPRATAIAHALGDEGVLADIQAGSAYALLGIGDTTEALAVAERVIHLAQANLRLMPLCQALHIAMIVHSFSGNLTLSRQYGQQGLEAAQRLDDPHWLASIESAYSQVAFFSGHWQEADAHAQRAVAIGRQVGFSRSVLYALIELARVRLAQGAVAEACSLLDESIVLTQKHQELFALRYALGLRAEYDLLSGHPQEARERLLPVLAGGALEDWGMQMLLPMLAWAQGELGEVPTAQELLTRGLACARARNEHLTIGILLVVSARLAMRQQHWQEAERALEEAVRLAQALPAPYVEAQARYVSGLVRLQQGAGEQAQSWLMAAGRLLHHLGERLYAERVEQALAALALEGVPAPEGERELP